MKWDDKKIYKPPPTLAQELDTECGRNIDAVRAEIPLLQDKINNMSIYSQRQIDEAYDALKKVEEQEIEVENIR